MNLQGVIIKGYSGFYYVWDGTCQWECSLRGKYRVKKQKFLPGDRVYLTIIDEDKKKAVIEKVILRKTELIRPAIANVEQVIIVMAYKDPEPDLWLLDRLLLMAQQRNVKPIICFNKADLLTAEQRKTLIDCYVKTGFPVIPTSTKREWGLETLREFLAESISVFAGPSGVGKSSLLNAIEKGVSLKTGEISTKLSRGKHTTRHVELIHLTGGGLLADTPGFSNVFLPEDLTRERLIKYYPDFWEYQDLCKYKRCLHRDEPDCAVRKATERGIIDMGRYERYLAILEEVIANERRY